MEGFFEAFLGDFLGISGEIPGRVLEGNLGEIPGGILVAISGRILGGTSGRIFKEFR